MKKNTSTNEVNKIMVIGLTGGIGTGKTTACNYLERKGFAHINADAIGRSLTEKGSPMLSVLDSIFGPEGELGTGEAILDEQGNLKRDVMATIVFAEQNRIDKLNEIMFAAIIERIKDQIQEYHSREESMESMPAILVDAPLLFESGVDSICDYTILITAKLETRIQRVCERDHVSREDVIARISRQMSDSAKQKLADFVIDNSGTEEELFARLDVLMEEIVVDKTDRNN